MLGGDPDSEKVKRKAEVENVFEIEAAYAKLLRAGGDLKLVDIVVDGSNWSRDDGFLAGVMRGAKPYHRTFTEEDVRETTDEGLRKLREKMSGLKLYEGWEPSGELAKGCVEWDTDW